MPGDDPLSRKIEDWEELFVSGSYLRPVGHGDMSPMDLDVYGWHSSPLDKYVRLEAYSKMVTAVLRQWCKIRSVCTEPYMTDPIFKVGKMAFFPKSVREDYVPYDLLEEQFQRLWLESPRPHDLSLRFLAINFGKHLPVSRAEISCLFDQDHWSFTAARVASKKGWVNDFTVLLKEVQDGSCELSASSISDLPGMGYSKRLALRWMRLLHPDSGFAQMVCERWERELKAEGLTLKEIYAYS